MTQNPTTPTAPKAMHLPAPWKYHLGRGANPRFHIQTQAGYQIASTTELSRHGATFEENAGREANAAHIVKAVNEREGLVEALRALAYDVESYGLAHPELGGRFTPESLAVALSALDLAKS